MHCVYFQQIHSLLMCYYPQLLEGMANMTPSRHLSILSRNLFHCLCIHKMVKFRPITLTLAIISLELEQITTRWLSIINTVQKLADVSMINFVNFYTPQNGESTGISLPVHACVHITPCFIGARRECF